MKLNLKVAWLKQLKKAGGSAIGEDQYHWRGDDNWCEVEIEKFTQEDVEKVLKIAQESTEKGSRAVIQKINMFNKLKVDLEGTKISRLEPLAHAMRQYIMPSKHKWLFEEYGDGQIVPWYVRKVEYHPPSERTDDTAHVLMSLGAARGAESVERTVRWDMEHLGHDVVTILKNSGLYLETPEAVLTYEKQMEHYKAIQSLTGHQFLAYGSAFERSAWGRRYYRSDLISMERDGDPAKVVMDDMVTDEGEARKMKQLAVSSAFWLGKGEDLDDMDKEDKVVSLPIQPYVNVFDLYKHDFAQIHTSNLKAYDYDPSLINKLILSQERKDLISILITGADMQLEDIVKGKTGGIEVICTGPPGTGKTLTAEVFSEQIRRPLYCVQCSQLGTSPSELEKELQTVLGRAARWKAILLIDEADVYIHTRGEDIDQNAIVGVFLRVLEHYRGVLFMTSNRDTIIDDAIMSRATAWIRYDYPDVTQLPEIWRVLSDNYGVVLTKKDIADICEFLPKISGRTIKNLLKLARLLSVKKGSKVDVSLIKYVSQFIELDVRAKKVYSLARAT